MRRITVILLSTVLVIACQPADDVDTPEAVVAPEPAPAAARPSDCQLSMGWDPWEPYHFSAAGGEVQGLDIELAEELAERAGCELEFVQGSWASLLSLIRVGELDLLPGATHTPEREEFSWFSAPYRQESFQIYVRAGESGQWQSDSLEAMLQDGFRVGVTQGYIYSEPINQLQMDERYRENFVEAAVGELNFSNLMDHGIDGFVEDPFVAAAIQRRRDWGAEIEPLDMDFDAGEVHLLFSRVSTSEHIVQQFDQALQDARADGTYDDIVVRYLDVPGALDQ